MTPDNYKFSLKLNRTITHYHKLAVDEEVIKNTKLILETTQVLKEKLGAIVIQLPASFKYDLDNFKAFNLTHNQLKLPFTHFYIC